MEFYKNFPFFTIVLAMAASMISGVLKGKYAKIITITVSGIIVVLSGYVFMETRAANESFIYLLGHSSAPWGNELRVGVLEAFTAFSFSIIFFISLLGGLDWNGQKGSGKKQNYMYIMFDLVLASMLVLIYTNDMFTAYVFIEINTIAACGLVASRQKGGALVATTKYLIMSLLGSGLFLIGLSLLYTITGQLLMPYLKQTLMEEFFSGAYIQIIPIIIGLFTIGLTMKSGLFPFYSWIPDLYSSASPSGSAMLSGLVSKAYIFLLIKLIYQVIGVEIWFASRITTILFIFGLIAMIFGSVMALIQKDIKRMVAYSSVAQIGYIYMGIGLATEFGIYAALFHVFSHGVSKALLFIAADGLSRSSDGSRQFDHLKGSGYRNIAAGIGFSIGSLSMIGIPLFAGFISKLNFAEASLQTPSKTVVTLIVLAISTLLNAVYFLRAVIVIYTPVSNDMTRTIGWRGEVKFKVAIAAFVALNFILGIASRPIMDIIAEGVSILGTSPIV
ncbi:MAG: proton-conducting transporter membrane subunit [bacterium]|nr:proton-conducting transporter membrane subunit [bacterium]